LADLGPFLPSSLENLRTGSDVAPFVIMARPSSRWGRCVRYEASLSTTGLW
jgi:hypothetical protein